MPFSFDTQRSAVVWEAIRIHPPVGLILERHVPKGGVDILGVHLPEDTVVGTNAWVLHRDKEIFGEDVEAFRPERWIEFPADQVRDMRKNIFTVNFPPCFLFCVAHRRP